ncbi:hypothetical protein CSC82_04080 [Rhodobacteraceae bacterium 4F10]|nr:hypothetical protein CSC82_04080 [Rhodobacteraceae bacterium 4F10]
MVGQNDLCLGQPKRRGVTFFVSMGGDRGCGVFQRRAAQTSEIRAMSTAQVKRAMSKSLCF